MKTTRIFISLMAVGSIITAGDITIPHVFSANTTAKASEVNANFNVLKTSVNEKISSITTSDSSGILATTTNNDVALKLTDGFISISPTTFVSGYAEKCFGSNPLLYLGSTPGPYYYFRSTSTQNICWASAPVNLPHGAKIRSLSCKLIKNDGKTNKGELSVRLYHSSTQIAKVELAEDFNDPDWQTVSDSVSSASHQTVDNENGSYYLTFVPPTISNTTDGEKDKLGECTIEYFYE